jgi:hypothetical protein
MRTRLDDLIATADRQLASRSYDAAVDTYRMALGEPGAAEAGVGDRLEAACRARDEARGIVRPVEAPAPPKAEMAVPPAAPPAELRMDAEPSPPAVPPIDREPPPAVPRIDLEPPAELRTDPEPPSAESRIAPELEPPQVVDSRPIEPPSFHLIDDDPFLLGSTDREQYPEQYREQYPTLEVEKLSILNPTPAPETLDPAATATRILVAMVIAIVVVVVAYYVK